MRKIGDMTAVVTQRGLALPCKMGIVTPGKSYAETVREEPQAAKRPAQFKQTGERRDTIIVPSNMRRAGTLIKKKVGDQRVKAGTPPRDDG